MKIRLYGMESQHCVMLIENALKKTKGVSSVKVSLANETAIVEGTASFDDLRNAIVNAGYDAELVADDFIAPIIEDEVKSYWNKFLISAVLSFPLLLVMASDFGLFALPEELMQSLGLIELFLVIPVLLVNREIFVRGVRSGLNLAPNMDSLVTLGVGSAVLYSIAVVFGYAGHLYFEAAAIILTFIALGKYLEALAKGRTSQAIKKLIGLQSKTALIIRKGKEIEVSIEEVVIGDLIIVKPGGKIPVDGVVIDGETYVDESMVTGESIPVKKKKGSNVIGATINQQGAIRFKATKVGKDTLLSQIIKLVEEAQASKSPIQELVDKVSSVFVPAVLVIAAIAFVYWFLVGAGFDFALTAFVSVLIIACPCALGLATPTAIMVGTGLGAENGILFKNSASLQKMKSVNAVIFDKTGTLTIGKPIVTNLVSLKGINANELLSLAASVELNSEHPLGIAIVNESKKRKLVLKKTSSFKSITGKGVSAKISNKRVLVGNAAVMSENKISIASFSKEIEKLESQAKTVMIIAVDGKAIGLIAVADAVKETSIQAVSELKKMGFKVAMITGDNERTAHAIAKQVGIETVFARVLPADKEKYVAQLQKEGFNVAMVGDGINDSPALAKADVGIAIGSGTDIAIETGEVILVKNDLRDVVKAIKLSVFVLKKIKQNLAWAFVFNIIGIPLAAGFFYPFTGLLLNPAIAGVAMAFSSVTVTTNSALMKNWKP